MSTDGDSPRREAQNNDLDPQVNEKLGLLYSDGLVSSSSSLFLASILFIPSLQYLIYSLVPKQQISKPFALFLTFTNAPPLASVQCSEKDVDENIRRQLRVLTSSDALDALAKLESALRTSNVRNLSAYLAGVIRRITQIGPEGPGTQVPLAVR